MNIDGDDDGALDVHGQDDVNEDGWWDDGDEEDDDDDEDDDHDGDESASALP